MLPVLAELAAASARLLPADVHAYLETGSGDETTLAEAEAAWSSWRLVPQVLAPVPEVSTKVRLFGQRLETPILVAPTAYHALVDPQGEVATARGARAAGSLLTLSTRATAPLHLVAESAGPWWFQVYVMKERAVTAALARRVADLGASALVLTGDTPYLGRKHRGHAGRPVSLEEESMRANVAPHLPAGVDIAAAVEQDPAVDFEAVGWLAEVSGLPVLVKGVLRADDAERCLAAGAAGVIVSNHGGRQLDRAVATADALPGVVRAVGEQMPVLVDGGIRSGTDALVALALGASAVLVGRPVLWGLAASGADGVASVIEDLTDDLRHVMGLLGVSSLDQIARSHVFHAVPNCGHGNDLRHTEVAPTGRSTEDRPRE